MCQCIHFAFQLDIFHHTCTKIATATFTMAWSFNCYKGLLTRSTGHYISKPHPITLIFATMWQWSKEFVSCWGVDSYSLILFQFQRHRHMHWRNISNGRYSELFVNVCCVWKWRFDLVRSKSGNDANVFIANVGGYICGMVFNYLWLRLSMRILVIFADAIRSEVQTKKCLRLASYYVVGDAACSSWHVTKLSTN